MANPEFGHESTCDEVSEDYGFNPLELVDGLAKTHFAGLMTRTHRRRKELPGEWGIAAAGDSSNTVTAGSSITLPALTRVVYTRTEEIDTIPGPTDDYAVPGAKAGVAGDFFLRAADAQYLRIHHHLVIEGKGQVPDGLDVRGTAVTAANIQSATYDAGTKIDPSVPMIIKDVSYNMPNEEWNNWSMTIEGWVANGATTTSQLVGSFTLITAGAGVDDDLDPSSDIFIPIITLTLSDSGFAILEESAQIYYVDAESTPTTDVAYPQVAAG